jgi:hypothetical protein
VEVQEEDKLEHKLAQEDLVEVELTPMQLLEDLVLQVKVMLVVMETLEHHKQVEVEEPVRLVTLMVLLVEETDHNRV